MFETVQCAGVTPRPWYKKINPLWWLGNDTAPPGSSFYYAYVRNPLQNFRWYVIGVVDRVHQVTGLAPAMTNERGDLSPPQTGWCLSVIWLGPIPLLPYVSYSSKSLTFYLGWQPAGGLGAKLNFSNSAYP